jgi:hypothetical protein
LFIREAMLKNNVFAVDVAEVPKSLHEPAKRYRFLFGATRVPQHSNLGSLSPLFGQTLGAPSIANPHPGRPENVCAWSSEHLPMGASSGVFDGAEGESVHTLPLGGERRGEQTASQSADKRAPGDHLVSSRAA